MTQSAKPRRPYQKPVLKKGPKLSDIAAVLKSPVKCWVARAAFGQDDVRWRVFRAWLMDDAPVWFRGAYIRYGAAVGTWLESHDSARVLVRSAMMLAIRRKLFW